MVHLQDGKRPTHSDKAPYALAYVIAGCFLFHLHPYILIYVYSDDPTKWQPDACGIAELVRVAPDADRNGRRTSEEKAHK